MKSKFKVGDRVRPTVNREAYYSNYGGNPRVVLTPDMVGTVAAVGVPYVTGPGGVFNCVDFNLPGVYMGDKRYGNTVWRGAFEDSELKKGEE